MAKVLILSGAGISAESGMDKAGQSFTFYYI